MRANQKTGLDKEVGTKTSKKNQKSISKSRIQELAHEIYLKRLEGDMIGNSESDWYEAEIKLKNM